jgi:hypothetical protein
MFGTGNVMYTQLGYLFRKNLLGEGNGAFMPYASLMSADYNHLRDRMNVIDVGINWFIKGHSGKLTLDYQNRPVYTVQTNELIRSGNRGQFVLQYQIFI